MSKVKNIVIVGVGGQGSLLASNILGSLLCDMGYDVKVSEVHGMAQRGGSVITYVRYGEEVASPLVTMGEADIVICFEELEALRAIPYLKKGGIMVVNTQQISPMPVITGGAEYPSDINDSLAKVDGKVVYIDALKLAKQAGSERAINVVCLGAASHFIDAPEALWERAIAENVKPRFVEMNKAAFSLGRLNIREG